MDARLGAISPVRWIRSELIAQKGWITWGVAGGTWLAWLALTWYHASLPAWFIVPAAAYTLALYGSLQHEALHELVASRRWVNHVMVSAPLNLWLPYPIYRASHLAHHGRYALLTDPHRDPESYYVSGERWPHLPRWWQLVLTFNQTLLGRLLIGPFLIVGQFLFHEAKALVQGDRRNLRTWLVHVPAVGLVMAWVTLACGMPAWQYVVMFAWPATALSLVRSFCEHIAHETPEERTALVEAGPVMSLLFLNNNLHYVHHKRPDLPWYAIPDYYRINRGKLRVENGGYVYDGGYLEIARRFLLTPFDSPCHPFH